MKYILLILISLPAFADRPQHWMPNPIPANKQTWAAKADCPGTCYPLLQDDGTFVSPDVAMFDGTKFVVDPTLQAAQDAAVATEADKVQKQKTAKQGIRAKINNATTLDDVKVVLKELLKALRADE